jgi:nicotinamide-nucleotide amidase
MSGFPADLLEQAEGVLAACRRRGLKVATAESCTGGLIAALLTEIPGSSDVVDRGFITYSNAAKEDLLGVSPEALRAHGAVSTTVAQAMAEGALARSLADLAVSVTGVAGPGGGSAAKPVGLVCFGLAHRGGATATLEKRFGDLGRQGIRLEAVRVALGLLSPGC